MLLREEFKGYKKYFEKCGLSLWELDSLKNYDIVMTTEHYEKQGRKCFPSKPTTSESQVISPREFCCYISGMAFFGDRVYKGSTPLGYGVVTRLTCVNPSNDLKIVRKFKYVYVK